MAKRNVSYIKPQEPEFLKRMKKEAGYVEKDTIETKKQVMPLDEDNEDKDEDEPVVVVLKPGDISADEAKRIKDQQKKEEESAPANLDDRIIFRAPTKPSEVEEEGINIKKKDDERRRSSSKGKGKKIKNKSLLSFDEEENDDS